MFARRLFKLRTPMQLARRNFWSTQAPKAIEPVEKVLKVDVPDGTVLNAVEQLPLLESITKLGDLKLIGLGQNTPSGIIQSFFELVYVSTGLPWWATIIIGSVGLRLMMFPIAVKSQQAIVKLHNMKPEIEPVQSELSRLNSIGDKQGAAVQMQKMQAVFKKHDASPLSALWGIAQLPIMISAFFGIKGMSDVGVPGFATEGLWWFKDLTASDPTYILPAISTAIMMATVEVNASVSGQQPSDFMKNLMRAVSVVAMFAMAWLPPAFFLYSIVTAIATLLQTWAFSRPGVRKALGIPLMDPNIKARPKSMLAVNRLSDKEAKQILDTVQKP
ncbi:60Kd inner membrane protein-domain-containing protein [Gorgonomyces haynaldii]|nr:60Kd inner membrane protein-domain-containing protein [Gorgonomyces haynaldii]